MNIHPAVYTCTNNGLSENEFIQSFQTLLTLNQVKNAYESAIRQENVHWPYMCNLAFRYP